jgi:hypothetical protein
MAAMPGIAAILVLASTFVAATVDAVPLPAFDNSFVPQPSHDVIYRVHGSERTEFSPSAEFKYKFLSSTGGVFNEWAPGRLEVSATLGISEHAHNTGTEIIRLMTRYMPSGVFAELARLGSVGLFTFVDKTTIFPEYEYLRDRPECAGTCAGACSNTCTGDGRKYDSLAGVGGSRGTCLDDNFMCTNNDPYYRQYSVLVHEFGHTIHQYALPGSSDYYNRINAAFNNARNNRIWDLNSYAMSNALEYFAEGTATFFNANRHPNSSGGMNGCGKPAGQFCSTETEARNWLQSRDSQLFDALSFTFTNFRPTLQGGLSVCMT